MKGTFQKTNKTKNPKRLDFIKIKALLNEWKDNPQWEKIYANHISDKRVVFKIYFRNSLNSIVRKQSP